LIAFLSSKLFSDINILLLLLFVFKLFVILVFSVELICEAEEDEEVRFIESKRWENC
jgi:hypothetical protein